jgi:hypothetical protein
MRVRMKTDVSGSRDGRAWPKRGETLDVSDTEGADLCGSGLAVPAADSDDTEKAVAPDDSETRALTTDNSAAVTPGDEEKVAAPAKKTAAKRTTSKAQGEDK